MSCKWINYPQEAGGIMPKVLIVDDSPSQLYSLRRLVEQGVNQADRDLLLQAILNIVRNADGSSRPVTTPCSPLPANRRSKSPPPNTPLSS